MAREKKQIVEVRPVEGAVIEKGVKSYSVPILYVLEDGIEVGSRFRRQRQRDVKAFLATLPAPPTSPTVACFDENGTFYGTEVTFSIGGTRSNITNGGNTQ